MVNKHLDIVDTTGDNSLTDEQIKALKKLTPENIETLKALAETTGAARIIMGIIVGIITVFGLTNFKSFLDSFIGK